MAAESLIRKLLAGERPTPGARSAAGALELADYERRFARRAIFTGVRAAPPAEAPLYARVLATAWQALPPQLRAMHDFTQHQAATGVASVQRGTGLIARCLGRLIGFPASAEQIPVHVSFTAAKGVERWTRTFGARSFHSEQYAGRGREAELVCERFGPLTMALALVWDGRHLRFLVRGWRCCNVPLPRWLAPVCDAHECVEGGRFRFDVAIRHRWTGLIVHYRGWLVPTSQPSRSSAAAGAPSSAAALNPR